ncbi:MAG TPA: HD domain-containing phosphohydrolase [Burkholderiales bacterium]|nr:HD domain-containing phosphohydrolase [Burkholderiales bacterium]
MKVLTSDDLLQRLEELNRVGVSLSKEKDINRLLENILIAAKNIVNADGGTLYRMVDERNLKFEIIRTDSLNITMGGTTGLEIPFYPVALYDGAGKPNNSMVVAYAVLHDQTVNIADAYSEQGFDFTGTKNFDKKTGYRSKSFLTIPMKNHENEIIGVLQLINAKDRASGEIIAFSATDQQLAESLASQAAIALTNRLLISQLENLFESFIGLINTAIDEKSPYTSGHCARVPVLTMMIAGAVNKTETGPLKSFHMSEKDHYELKIAGLLHDCGKVTTPVHVVDKATKLETIYDRINLIDTRFEVLKRDAEIELLKAKQQAGKDRDAITKLETGYRSRIKQLDQDREFLRKTNIGGEFMNEELLQRVRKIAAYSWAGIDGKQANFLTDDEVENLSIARGTLTAKEREIINNHVVVTIKMLEALPWPKHLRKVPEYAGGHHERVDGKGYPRGLKREHLSMQARIMGIADIFEALTAKDRPYKVGKTLTESLNILGRLRLDGHIDSDLFEVFVREKVYLEYARQFLDPAQIDEVDESKIPGHMPLSAA